MRTLYVLFSRPSVENLKTLQIPLQFCSIHNTHRDNFAYRSYMYLVCLIKLCSVYVIFEADFGNFEKHCKFLYNYVPFIIGIGIILRVGHKFCKPVIRISLEPPAISISEKKNLHLRSSTPCKTF